jgi:uncharacterized protein YndB with AHSA1/START domain
MADIRHQLNIKAGPEKVYEAITTREGLSGWWAKQTTAQPEPGYINSFTFGTHRVEMKITQLDTNKRVEWKCIKAIDEWIDTNVSFDLAEKDGRTVLRFTHSDWRKVTDTFAICTYDWGRFLASLKSYCETGAGSPA